MIYHVFNANVYHHVPHMIEEILRNAPETNKFGVEEHYFLLRDENNNFSSLSNNHNSSNLYLKVFKDYKTLNYKFLHNSLSFIKCMFMIESGDRIIIHSTQTLFGRNKLFWLLLFIMGNNFRKRCSIILWGVAEKQKISKNLFSGIFNEIKKIVLKSLRYVVTLSLDDSEKIKDWFKISNVIISGYIRDTYNEFKVYTKLIDESQELKKIMISHSSFSHNYHIEILNLLGRFKDENIEIICPLSYGSIEYREIVIGRGKQIFGDKFKYYDKLLSRSEYNNLLASIDIYISNALMQTGLYVIAFCICAGKKLYLRGNNYNWMTHLGFKVNNVKEIGQLSYNDFINPVEDDWQVSNDLLASEVFSIKPKIEDWKLFYS